MPFKLQSKGKPGAGRRFLASTITITPSGIYLNTAAIREIGVAKDGFKWVLVYFDDESIPKRMGFWFFRHKTENYKKSFYKVSYNPIQFSAKISCKHVISRYRLTTLTKQLGQSKFRLYLDKNHETKKDYYIAKLEE